jgi:hypothetical protein
VRTHSVAGTGLALPSSRLPYWSFGTGNCSGSRTQLQLKMKPRACAGASRRTFQRCLEDANSRPANSIPKREARNTVVPGTQFWDAGPN